MDAIAQDDELAAQRDPDETTPRRPPPVAEFGPVEELLAAIHDRLGHQIVMTAAAGGAKKLPPTPKPWPRPVTATQRARSRRHRAASHEIVAAFAPHEADGDA